MLSKSFLSSQTVPYPPTSTDTLGSKDCFLPTESWKQRKNAPITHRLGGLILWKHHFHTILIVPNNSIAARCYKLLLLTWVLISHSIFLSLLYSWGSKLFLKLFIAAPTLQKCSQAYLCLKVIFANCMPKPLSREQSVWVSCLEFECT